MSLSLFYDHGKFICSLFDYVLTGHLITSVNDVKILLMRILSTKEITHGKSMNNRGLLVSLMEPTIEYTMKCIFKDASQVSKGVSGSNLTCLIPSSLML